MSMERENKIKSCMMTDEPINNLFHTSPYTPVYCNQGPPPKMITQGHGKEIDSSYSWSNKRKRIKVYHSLPMTYKRVTFYIDPELRDFLSSLPSLEGFPNQEGTMLMPGVSIIEGS